MNKELLNSYIKIKELAIIKGVTDRAIRKAIDHYQYRTINGNGGKQYEILVSSLEPELQKKIFENYSNTQNNSTAIVLSGADTTAPVSIQNFDKFAIPAVFDEKIIKNTLATFGLNKVRNNNFAIPFTAKQKALFKVDIIKKWEEHRVSFGKKNKLKADKNFEELFNQGFISEKLLKEVGTISIKSLYRWAKEYRNSNNNYIALVDGYNYGSELQLTTFLTDIEKFLLLKYMLHQNQYSLGKAYELIKVEMTKLGYRDLSGIGAYRRLWNYLCLNYSDMITFAREGKKAALDKKLPYIARDRSKLNVGDALVGDGHVLDFMVKNPLTGKPVRATLVAFLDWRSLELCGYEIMVSENTQSIASALRNSIINLGKMPKVVYIDNGKAFKNKAFNGIKADFSDNGISGIYEKLGIDVQFSKPYNGREKIIERFWKEFTSSFAKLMPSYIGNNIENQPACTKRNEKFHKKLQGDYVPTIEETKALIEHWLNNVYRKRIDKYTKLTICELFNQNKGKGVNVDILDDLMMATEERKIGRNGIRLFNELYYAPELTGLNVKVIAKYNMFDLSYIKVYSTNGDFICKAEKQISISPLATHLGTAKDLHDLRTKQKQMKKIEKERLKPIKTALSSLYGYYSKKQVNIKPQECINNEYDKYQITCYEKL